MATRQMFDTKTNRPAGTMEIPDDVLRAAALVEAWMRAHGATELHGLRLATGK